MDTLESDNTSTQVCSFDRLMGGSPSTSTSKNSTLDTQALINQTILQQLSAIGEGLQKLSRKKLRKLQGPIDIDIEVL